MDIATDLDFIVGAAAGDKPTAFVAAHLGRVYSGMGFQIREGQRVLARGRITKILHHAESAERVTSKR